jgi:hypothetical protein
MWSWDSSVGIAMGYGLTVWVQFLAVQDFSLLLSIRPPLGPIQCVTGALSPGVKQQGSEPDHWPSSSAKVKNLELYLQSPICLHGVVLNKAQGKLFTTKSYALFSSWSVQIQNAISVTGKWWKLQPSWKSQCQWMNEWAVDYFMTM